MLARGKRGDFYPEQEEEVEEKRSRPRNKLIPTEVVLPKKDLPVKYIIRENYMGQMTKINQ